MSEAVLLMLCVAVTLIAVWQVSNDLVKRLRTEPNWMREDYPQSEAADRIEAQTARIAELEAALQSIVEYCDDPYLPYYKDILSKARAALEGGKQ